MTIGNNAELRAVNRKVWESNARKNKTGLQLIWDGNKLAWSQRDLGEEIKLTVDLDAEQKRPAGRKPNTFNLVIRRTKVLDLSVIQAYLDGRIQSGVPVLEAVNFLDHLLREGPSLNPRFIPIRRQYFVRDGQRTNLGGAIEVFRGVYQSLRLAEGKRLVINLDVANCCFWMPTSILSAVMTKFNLRDAQGIINQCRPVQQNGSRLESTFQRVMAKTFKKVRVRANYAGNPAPDKVWIIEKFSIQNAREYEIDRKENGQVKERCSVADYFRKKYNVGLQYPQLPLVEMTKSGVMYPMEFLNIVENQRYPFKLDEKQTANMIKFAVSQPAQRQASINEGKGWLNWAGDKVLGSYGMKVQADMIKTNARLLPNPSIKFGANKVENPSTKGRWDLRNKKFLTPNTHELIAWGVGVFGNGRTQVSRGAIDKFIKDLTAAYRAHGGRVSNAPPHSMQLPNDPAQAVEALHQATGNKYQRRPQLLVFVVQDKNSFHYSRIKKSCDCRYGVVSQVMQAAQVLKGNNQYYSNVLMKVNAKLGGCTTQVVPAASSGFSKGFTTSTMIIGADVSHASPGSPQASMAALSISFDRHGGRYAAACETNGHRVEMITEANFRSMLGPLATQWVSQVGGGSVPKQVYYFRDGVSEGQFAHVLQQEVPHIRAVLSKILGGNWGGKLTVIIASKRHNIRAFPGPGAGDPKNNPLPGILIEHDCTSPNEWDFFLYSHIALQGTSRPVHYTVLYDDANHPPNVIQNMIYEHCYQYMRSTTSVSLFPAVYYAHLASNRARAHEDIRSSEGPQSGPGYKQNAPPSSATPASETEPLMPMYNANGIAFTMWYI